MSKAGGLNEWFNRNVGRHFLSLSCIQTSSERKKTAHVFSGFMIEIECEWVFVTAGHILRFISLAKDRGSTFDIWRLSDATARGRFQDKGIPFDFDPAEWVVIYDEDTGLDYAAMILRPIYRDALTAGDARPLPDRAWTSHRSKHDYWALMGVPEETVRVDEGGVLVGKTFTLVLEPVESPEGPSEKDQLRFYAALVGDSENAVRSVSGMSGGPVFSLLAIDGVWHYSVIGIQSGWFPADRVLIACSFAWFATLLAAAIRSLQSSMTERK